MEDKDILTKGQKLMIWTAVTAEMNRLEKLPKRGWVPKRIKQYNEILEILKVEEEE